MNRLSSVLQGLGIGTRALLDRHHPILAQIVPIRRCNLACGYCNEYDKVSPPVPTSNVRAWIDKLADLRTEIVTLSGGEPHARRTPVFYVAWKNYSQRSWNVRYPFAILCNG